MKNKYIFLLILFTLVCFIIGFLYMNETFSWGFKKGKNNDYYIGAYQSVTYNRDSSIKYKKIFNRYGDLIRSREYDLIRNSEWVRNFESNTLSEKIYDSSILDSAYVNRLLKFDVNGDTIKEGSNFFVIHNFKNLYQSSDYIKPMIHVSMPEFKKSFFNFYTTLMKSGGGSRIIEFSSESKTFSVNFGKLEKGKYHWFGDIEEVNYDLLNDSTAQILTLIINEYFEVK